MKQLSLFSSEESLLRLEPSKVWELYVDGASRNNPGEAGAGVYIRQNKSHELKKHFYLGVKTNNQAEYLALLLGFYFLESLMNEQDMLHVFSDSELMIRQLGGIYKVKQPVLQDLNAIARNFLKEKKYVLNHILREKNTVADKLANEGINKRTLVPGEFEAFCNRYRVL